MTQQQIDDLGESIRLMDRFSQDGFERIRALAKLVLLAMQAPEAYQSPSLEGFAHVLSLIEEIAECTMNDINGAAEQAGKFEYSDPASEARWEARRRWRLSISEAGRA